MLVKITNTAAIDAALTAANGRASTHTYHSAFTVRCIAEAAEKRLEKIGVPKAIRAGATVTALSGDKLPNAYQFTPIRTRIILTRRATGWFLTEIETTKFGAEPGERLTLTEDQDNAAVAHFRKTAAKL
jgi:hypothetical protein